MDYSGATLSVLGALRKGGSAWASRLLLKILVREKYLVQWREFASLAICPTKGNVGLEMFCQQLAAELSIPFYKPFLKKVGHFQHGRNAKDRMEGELFVEWAMRGECASPCLLFDDVKTTGTTLDQCAYLLRKRGLEVKTFTFARMSLVKGFEGKSKDPQQESHEVDPFLLHLFM